MHDMDKGLDPFYLTCFIVLEKSLPSWNVSMITIQGLAPILMMLEWDVHVRKKWYVGKQRIKMEIHTWCGRPSLTPVKHFVTCRKKSYCIWRMLHEPWEEALHEKYITSLLLTVATTCTHGNIRLAGGLDPTDGRVEVCVEGRWTGVCDSSWNYQDAFVACRQLGYPATGLD